MRSDLIDIEVEFVHATDKAVGIKSPIGDSDDPVWIAKSMCETDPEPDECRRGQGITITLSRSLAQEKGLI